MPALCWELGHGDAAWEASQAGRGKPPSGWPVGSTVGGCGSPEETSWRRSSLSRALRDEWAFITVWYMSYNRRRTGQGVRRPGLQASTILSMHNSEKVTFSPGPASTSIKQGFQSSLTVCRLKWLIGRDGHVLFSPHEREGETALQRS